MQQTCTSHLNSIHTEAVFIYIFCSYLTEFNMGAKQRETHMELANNKTCSKRKTKPSSCIPAPHQGHLWCHPKQCLSLLCATQLCLWAVSICCTDRCLCCCFWVRATGMGGDSSQQLKHPVYIGVCACVSQSWSSYEGQSDKLSLATIKKGNSQRSYCVLKDENKTLNQQFSRVLLCYCTLKGAGQDPGR